MKKILAVVLALTMIVGMSIPAFAADLNDTKRSTTLDPVTYTFAASGADVLGVNVSWTALSFAYTQGAWDPDTLDYTTDAKWDADSKPADITVENCSNVGVTVKASWTAALTGATAVFTGEKVVDNTLTLDAATVGNPVSGTIGVTVSVAGIVPPAVEVGQSANVGTITVEITSPAQE